jgi:ER-bound oxygenase mpaB/B'/Rubber oxygenase, catalytic domain
MNEKEIRKPEFQKRMMLKGDVLADSTIQKIAVKGKLGQVTKILSGLIRNDDMTSIMSGDQLFELSPSFLDTEKYKISTEQKQAAKDVGGILSDYLIQSGTLPEALGPLDPDLLRISEEIFTQYAMTAFSILGCASLPEAYATTYASRVLATTQQLQTHIHRRISETTLFVINVMSKDGLNPGGAGMKAAQKVRLMHAAMRYLLLLPPTATAPDSAPRDMGDVLQQMTWPTKELGVPLHQLSMSMAILSFSYIVLRSLKKLGIDLSPIQEKAYLYRWNVIAHVMGVEPELLLCDPVTMDQAEQMYEAIWPPAVAETLQGRALEKALLDYLEGFVPKTLGPLTRIPRILTRELIGPKMARVLDINLGFRDNLGLQAMKAMTGLHRYGRNLANVIGIDVDWADNAGLQLMKGAIGLDHLNTDSIDEFPPIRIAAEWLFRQMAKQLNTMQRGGNRAPFQIPDTLTKPPQTNPPLTEPK